MAQRLRAPAALAEVLPSSTQWLTSICNSSLREADILFWPPQAQASYTFFFCAHRAQLGQTLSQINKHLNELR